MLHSYYTVKGYGEHEINIQKSRFIAYIDRATTELEAQEFIQKVKNKTGMQPIIVPLISLEKTIKFKKQTMMANQVELLVCQS